MVLHSCSGIPKTVLQKNNYAFVSIIVKEQQQQQQKDLS